MVPTDGWNIVGMQTAISRDGAYFAANVGLSLPSANPRLVKYSKYAIKVWEIATLQPVALMETTKVGFLNFTPDGKRIVCTADDTISTLDLVSEKESFRKSTNYRPRYGESFACAFRVSPDGRKVATGLLDSTTLLWELPPQVEEKAKPLTQDRLEQCWTDLAGTDARRAFLAVHKLTAAPQETLALLRERLKPAKTPDTEEMRRLLAELGDEAFLTRDAAAKRLDQLGPEANGVLRLVKPRNAPLELERRLEKHFAGTHTIRIADDRRHVRAIRALEQINSPEARKLLKSLADGAADAWRTRAAQTAIGALNAEATAR